MRSGLVMSVAVMSLVGCARAVSGGAAADIDAGVAEPDAPETIDATVPPDGALTDAHVDPTSPDAAIVIDAATPVDAATAVDAATPDATPPIDAATVDGGILCAHPINGTLLTYAFDGQPGNQASTPPMTAATGVTGGAVVRAATLNANTGANSINASNWALGTAPDGTRYFSFTLTPEPSCALDLASIAIDTKASTTGPGGGAVGTSMDAFAKKVTFTPGTASTLSLTATGAQGAIEVRVYGFDASSAAGTLRLQGVLTVSGTLR